MKDHLSYPLQNQDQNESSGQKDIQPSLTFHHKPKKISDWVAYGLCQALRWIADCLFRARYGHRAIVIETIAAIPGMVGALFIHLRCLRKQWGDYGRIHTLTQEAENEKMHLMVFVEITKPSRFDYVMIYIAQFFFCIGFSLLYMISPKTAHRMIGYFEEEAIKSYTTYLKALEDGEVPNTAAPLLAIRYWNLPESATVYDVVWAVREDECRHRDANHQISTTYWEVPHHVSEGPLASHPSQEHAQSTDHWSTSKKS